MREILYHGGGWAQMEGTGVQLPDGHDVATALAHGVVTAQFTPPGSGGGTNPVGAVVIRNVWVLGHEYRQKHRWAVTGDASTAAGWTQL